MSSGWPKEPAFASWSVIVLAQCRSRMSPLFAVAAPVVLDPAGPSLHLGASRSTVNAQEVSTVAVAYLIIHFLRSPPECAALPAFVTSDSLTAVQLVQLQATASGNADLVRNARSLKAVSTELQHIFVTQGTCGTRWLTQWRRRHVVKCGWLLRHCLACVSMRRRSWPAPLCMSVWFRSVDQRVEQHWLGCSGNRCSESPITWSWHGKSRSEAWLQCLAHKLSSKW